MEEKYLNITDVTLREWDQAPFTSFDEVQKKVIALMLSEMWVNTIEIWFWANKTDFNNIEEVSKIVWDSDVVLSSLWRSIKSDTTASINALKNVKNPRIHIFAAMSKEHIKWKFQKEWMSFKETQKNILNSIIENIKLVKEKDNHIQIEFSPEDATWNALIKEKWKKYFKLKNNLDFDFLVKVCEEAIKSWANIINVPDTLWNLTSNQTYDFFIELNNRLNHLKSKYTFWLSSHIHNDLASASESTIQAIRWWADYVETTIYWLWERSWNAPTEEVVWIISEKWHDLVEWMDIKLNPKFKTELLWPISDFVSKIIQLDKSIQRPFIWALSDRDWSWVHNANWDLYWGSKNKKLYWWADLPEFFSARWWANQLVSMLSKYWVKLDKDDIKKLVWIFWEKSEKTRGLFWKNVYSTYLKEKWEFKITKLETNDNKLNLEIYLKWEKIVFNWKIEWNNSSINTFIKLINNSFWYNKVKIKDLKTKSKPNIITEINNFKKRTLNILSDNFNEKINEIIKDIDEKPVSESKAITQVILEIDWEEIYSISSDNNTTNSWIKAILDWIIDII